VKSLVGSYGGTVTIADRTSHSPVGLTDGTSQGSFGTCTLDTAGSARGHYWIARRERLGLSMRHGLNQLAANEDFDEPGFVFHQEYAGR
jgi:hypothetical protein